MNTLTLNDCRPQVLLFAIAMERELRANDHKRGWHASDIVSLAARVREEAGELLQAVVALSAAPNPSRATVHFTNVRSEAADVANMAMMVADVLELNSSFFAFDLVAHINRQKAFSERTFGPGPRAKGVVDHIRKELAEIEASPADLSEWVDVILLALDGAWRSGASPEQIAGGIKNKQDKNERRTWPDWQTADPDKAIEHDRGEL